jgi:hypothetical protein
MKVNDDSYKTPDDDHIGYIRHHQGISQSLTQYKLTMGQSTQSLTQSELSTNDFQSQPNLSNPARSTSDYNRPANNMQYHEANMTFKDNNQLRLRRDTRQKNHWMPADSVNEMTTVKEGLTNETNFSCMSTILIVLISIIAIIAAYHAYNYLNLFWKE